MTVQGACFFCKSVYLDAASDILQAEAAAILVGVKLARDVDLRKVIRESDALILILELRAKIPQVKNKSLTTLYEVQIMRPMLRTKPVCTHPTHHHISENEEEELDMFYEVQITRQMLRA
ncbi:hypothetical protein ACFE04_014162 [Oxalis oulophora]